MTCSTVGSSLPGRLKELHLLWKACHHVLVAEALKIALKLPGAATGDASPGRARFPGSGATRI